MKVAQLKPTWGGCVTSHPQAIANLQSGLLAHKQGLFTTSSS